VMASLSLWVRFCCCSLCCLVACLVAWLLVCLVGYLVDCLLALLALLALLDSLVAFAISAWICGVECPHEPLVRHESG